MTWRRLAFALVCSTIAQPLWAGEKSPRATGRTKCRAVADLGHFVGQGLSRACRRRAATKHRRSCARSRT